METSKCVFPTLSHPLTDIVERETNEYFLAHWSFPDVTSRDKFLSSGFSRMVCMYYPKAKDDRIHFACRLIVVILLIDDLLDNMSFDEGAAYNDKLMSIVQGDKAPDSSVPAETILYNTWSAMRAHDQELTDEIREPLFILMRSQPDERRAQSMSLRQYFEYRDADFGRAFFCAVMRFCLDIRLTQHELETVKPVELNLGKHLAVTNDVLSFEKEVLTAKRTNAEISSLCNSVAILSIEMDLSTAASKRLLQCAVREWEHKHRELVEKLLLQQSSEKTGLISYFQGLEYQMSGYEVWCKTTPRYRVGEIETVP
ncbi:Aristolochene synthase in complex with 12,13-Difluorofarnesyl diphosphate [Nemania abortiva]|nr:Aristolochene synthase in complex with 12,13-Difluorofarnesyl diphosphate [Nemania abortiva]